jgi:hypothetical protein
VFHVRQDTLLQLGHLGAGEGMLFTVKKYTIGAFLYMAYFVFHFGIRFAWRAYPKFEFYYFWGALVWKVLKFIIPRAK